MKYCASCQTPIKCSNADGCIVNQCGPEAPVPTKDRRIDNLRQIGADESVNNFARSICNEAAAYLSAAAPDEEAKHRIEAFEEAARICDRRAEAAHLAYVENNARGWDESARLDSLQVACCRGDAIAIRALADRERG